MNEPKIESELLPPTIIPDPDRDEAAFAGASVRVSLLPSLPTPLSPFMQAAHVFPHAALRQAGSQFLKDARKLLAYKRDLLDEKTVADFDAGIQRLESAVKDRNERGIEEAAKDLDKQCSAFVTSREGRGVAGELRVFLVAIVVALGECGLIFSSRSRYRLAEVFHAEWNHRDAD